MGRLLLAEAFAMEQPGVTILPPEDKGNPCVTMHTPCNPEMFTP